MDDFMTCSHPARVSGMCAICGKVLDEEELRQLDGGEELHDIAGVQVTAAEAARIDSESTKRLLTQRKLALIVDLDQTIIHATVDPTVGEWMKDNKNANFKALADVGKFLLGVDGKAVMGKDASTSLSDEEAMASVQDGCWYYVKPRPGLQGFLNDLSERYEMHVYTMGTRTYAESVCKLVDPTGSLFGARIISRDENGSLLQKSLSKLFPMDTSMVVIIDDRADVWQWSPNLVRVSPFDFFVGIGDINASFLPTLSTGPTLPAEAAAAGTTDNEEKKGQTTDQTEGKNEQTLEAEAKAEDDAAKTVAEESQKNVVHEQLDARPLAKMQEALDGGNTNEGGRKESNGAAAVLKETDRELTKIQEILDTVHSSWYQQYDARSPNHIDEKPSITQIISQIKTAVLEGCTFVFSSIAPVNQDPGTTELWRLANEFGGVCKRTLDSTVTHVIAAKQGTEKVITGHRRKLNVVWYTWLQESCAHWCRQDETQYALPNPSNDQLRKPPPKGGGEDTVSGNASTSSNIHNEGNSSSNQTEEALTDSDGIDGDDLDGEDDDDDGQGFGEMDWDEANDEVDAVLNGLSDDDDSTTNGDGYESERSRRNSGGKGVGVGGNGKMKRTLSNTSLNGGGKEGDDVEEDEDNEEIGDTLSPLSKRRRMAELRAGHSKLKQVFDATSSDSRNSSMGPLNQKSDTREEKKDGSGHEGKNPTDAEEGEGEEDGDEDFLKALEDELALQIGTED